MILSKLGIDNKCDYSCDVSTVASELERNTYIVLDVETWKTETFTGKHLLGCALGVPVGNDFYAWYVEPDELKQLWPILRNKELIMHNAGFDLQILEENGMVTDKDFWDTMIMQHLCDENLRSYELDQLGLMFFKHRKMDIKELEKAFQGWEKIPFVGMGQYAINDLHITWKLFLKNLAGLQEQNLLGVWTESMKYIRALKSTRAEGIVIDWELLGALQSDAEQRCVELEELIGFPPGKRNQLIRTLYGSPQEGGLGLRPPSYTSKGQPAVDVAAIKTLQERYPQHQEFFKHLQEWRKLQKAITTWYEGFRLRNSEGLLHPGLKQHGTKTGRLSCAEPNLQQIPREKSRVKRLFKRKDDYYLVEFDYSQIELVVGAWYANKFKDSTMFNLYLDNADVHDRTSQLVNAYAAFPENPKEGRQVGKEGNFLWIYGGGAARLHAQLVNKYRISCSIEQCQDWTSKFHESYPGFRQAITYFQNLHRKQGYIEYWNGRRNRIRETDLQGRTKHHIAFNHMVQGGVGQILMYTINRVYKAQELGRINSKLCSTVHDSLWFYVPESQLQEESEKIFELMSYHPERVFAPLPFKVEASILDPE